MSQITLLKNDFMPVPTTDLEDSAFTEMVDGIKRRYRQLAEYLGVVCRVDLQTPKGFSGLRKVEKILDTVLRDLMSNDALVAISLVSRIENGNYVIAISGHFQNKPWHKPEGLPLEVILKGEKIGVAIEATCQTGIKLSYDIYLCR